MATAAIRMSLMTGRAVPRACFARTSTTTSTITPGSRRLLTTSSPAKNAQANSSKAAGEQQHETMDWNTYFALRKTRRNYERTFMVPSALVSLLGAGYYFAQRDFDPTPIFGMDQVIVYGIGTVAAGLVGLAMGPVIGNSVFRAANSRAKPLVDRVRNHFGAWRVNYAWIVEGHEVERLRTWAWTLALTPAPTSKQVDLYYL